MEIFFQWLTGLKISPMEIPLERVELSACPRDGACDSMTLSSSRCRGPALGNVALLNSTVFILWMKLQKERCKDLIKFLKYHSVDYFSTFAWKSLLPLYKNLYKHNSMRNIKDTRCSRVDAHLYASEFKWQNTEMIWSQRWGLYMCQWFGFWERMDLWCMHQSWHHISNTVVQLWNILYLSLRSVIP